MSTASFQNFPNDLIVNNSIENLGLKALGRLLEVLSRKFFKLFP